MKGKRLIAVAGALLLVAAGIAITLHSTFSRHLKSVQCGNQMSSIGLAARLWADDTGNYPADFSSLSNEINAAIILHCPADTSRPVLRSWVGLSRDNISYEIMTLGMSKKNSEGLFFRCKVHG